MHLVSVIMPYFKKRNYVEKSIRSVINQTYKMFELIIIYDDEDKSDLNFIKEIIGNNEKVKLIINENNIYKILFVTALMCFFLYFGLVYFEDKLEYTYKFKLIYLF